MTRDIQWLRVSIEGLVIVSSILLALAGDAWWDGVKERTVEHDALERLSAEFAEVDATLVAWQSNHQSVSDAAEVLLEHTGPAQPLSLLADSIGALIWTVMNVWTVDPPTATLSSLESSGRLGLIRDQEILTQLASWRSLMADLQADEQSLLRYSYDVIQPYLVSRVGWRSVSFFSRDTVYSGGPSNFPDDLVGVLSDREFEGHMDMRRTETANLLLNYVEIRASLGQLRASVEGELAR